MTTYQKLKKMEENSAQKSEQLFTSQVCDGLKSTDLEGGEAQQEVAEEGLGRSRVVNCLTGSKMMQEARLRKNVGYHWVSERVRLWS